MTNDRYQNGPVDQSTANDNGLVSWIKGWGQSAHEAEMRRQDAEEAREMERFAKLAREVEPRRNGPSRSEKLADAWSNITGVARIVATIPKKPAIVVEATFVAKVVGSVLNSVGGALGGGGEDAETAGYVARGRWLAQRDQEVVAAEKRKAIYENRLSEAEQQAVDYVRGRFRGGRPDPADVDVLLRTRGRQAAIDALVASLAAAYEAQVLPANRSGAQAASSQFRDHFTHYLIQFREAHGLRRMNALLGTDNGNPLRAINRLKPTTSNIKSIAKANGAFYTFLGYDAPVRTDGRQPFDLTVTEAAAVTLLRHVLQNELGVSLKPYGSAADMGISEQFRSELVTALQHCSVTFASYQSVSSEAHTL